MGQAIQFGQSPRLTIIRTSVDEKGQIYIPALNWILMVATIAIVLGFKTSDNLATAYGVAVSSTMVITTILMFFVERDRWHWNVVLVGHPAGRLPDRGLDVLQRQHLQDMGRRLAAAAGRSHRFHHHVHLEHGPLATSSTVCAPPPNRWTSSWHISAGSSRVRVRGTAIFMTAPNLGTPPMLQHHLEHNQVLHEQIVLLTVLTDDVPFVHPDPAPGSARSWNWGSTASTCTTGSCRYPNIPQCFRRAKDFGLTIDPETVTYYLGRETLVSTKHWPSMMGWREKLFAFMSRNAIRATDFYQIPPDRTVELGLRLRLDDLRVRRAPRRRPALKP